MVAIAQVSHPHAQSVAHWVIEPPPKSGGSSQGQSLSGIPGTGVDAMQASSETQATSVATKASLSPRLMPVTLAQPDAQSAQGQQVKTMIAPSSHVPQSS
jgi:hypothetical protein